MLRCELCCTTSPVTSCEGLQVPKDAQARPRDSIGWCLLLPPSAWCHTGVPTRHPAIQQQMQCLLHQLACNTHPMDSKRVLEAKATHGAASARFPLVRWGSTAPRSPAPHRHQHWGQKKTCCPYHPALEDRQPRQSAASHQPATHSSQHQWYFYCAHQEQDLALGDLYPSTRTPPIGGKSALLRYGFPEHARRCAMPADGRQGVCRAYVSARLCMPESCVKRKLQPDHACQSLKAPLKLNSCVPDPGRTLQARRRAAAADGWQGMWCM